MSVSPEEPRPTDKVVLRQQIAEEVAESLYGTDDDLTPIMGACLDVADAVLGLEPIRRALAIAAAAEAYLAIGPARVYHRANPVTSEADRRIILAANASAWRDDDALRSVKCWDCMAGDDDVSWDDTLSFAEYKHALHDAFAALRAVGVVDPKPASSDDRFRASRAPVDTQP